MKKKQTAVEYLMSLDPKMRKTVISAFQMLDEDLKRERKLKKISKAGKGN